MRLSRRTTLVVAVVGLAAAGGMIPAGVAHAGGGNGGVTPPTTSNNGGQYTVVVQGNVSLSGNPAPPGISTGGTYDGYTPPACWLQPWYKQPESWAQGDPVQSDVLSAPDADSYWWAMADKFPNLIRLINMNSRGGLDNARQEINDDFKMVQQGTNDNGGGAVGADWIWWAPNWVQTSAGWACAQGLMGGADMNNGFLDLEPPQPPGQANHPGQITSTDLAALARAALRLPTFKIVTEPGTAANTTAFVNTPTKVWLQFNGPKDPWDRAQATWRYGTYLQATIRTTGPVVSLSTSDQGAQISEPNPACLKAAPCSITFNAPSMNPYTITATATWTITWTANPGGQHGAFPNGSRTQTRTIVVREIQSVN